MKRTKVGITPDCLVGIYLFWASLLAIIVFVGGMALAVLREDSKASGEQLGLQYYSGFESGYRTGLDSCYETYEWIGDSWAKTYGNKWCDKSETISNCFEDCKANFGFAENIILKVGEEK